VNSVSVTNSLAARCSPVHQKSIASSRWSTLFCRKLDPKNQFHLIKILGWLYNYFVIDNLLIPGVRGSKGLELNFIVFLGKASAASGRSHRGSVAFRTLTGAWATLNKPPVNKRLNKKQQQQQQGGYGKIWREVINQTIMCFVIPRRVFTCSHVSNTWLHTFQSVFVWCSSSNVRVTRYNRGTHMFE